MKNFCLILLILFFTGLVKAQTGYTCADAIPLTNLNNACSDSAQYNNSNSAQNGVTWFRFTADTSAVYITVNGKDAGGSLVSPQINMIYGCAGAAVQNSKTSINGNTVTLFADDLGSGVTYYVAVSGANNATGTFKVCINNFAYPALVAYCDTATYLCSTASVYQKIPRIDLTVGSSENSASTKHTCTDAYVFSASYNWFKWTAANSGTLVFSITPKNALGSAMFNLFDLGTNGDCSNANASANIRCVAWSSYHCTGLPGNNSVGLDFEETDISEDFTWVCQPGPDGYVQYVTMTAGHNYALLVQSGQDYPYSGTFKRINNTDFTLTFRDSKGRTGTGQFAAVGQPIIYSGISGSGCTSDHNCPNK